MHILWERKPWLYKAAGGEQQAACLPTLYSGHLLRIPPVPSPRPLQLFHDLKELQDRC